MAGGAQALVRCPGGGAAGLNSPCKGLCSAHRGAACGSTIFSTVLYWCLILRALSRHFFLCMCLLNDKAFDVVEISCLQSSAQ